MRYLSLILLLLSAFILKAQKSNKFTSTFYAFDKEEKATTLENAAYLGVLEKRSDTCYQWRYYRFTGPLIATETYRDQSMTIPHGYFAFFDAQGRTDSAGYFYQGSKDGSWLYYSDKLEAEIADKYEQGKFISRKFLKDEKAETDSSDLNDPDGREASFKGGDNAWIRYLQKKLEYPQRAEQLGAAGKVSLLFVVNTSGQPVDVEILQSVEYSLDEVALKIIRDSPNWIPALKNGKAINAYRRQPITFGSPSFQ